ncbi:MAG: helix-turn-helix domain-containing protein [Trichococcus flocculiformis]|uniref:winged helix-turn-helix transcriptional regulator n=1 Tax=Trichococcus TaxID=82802 RepID=UPI000838E95B|nr:MULTISPECIES: helix-turn-helix domain-containing protein [Trichococcus]MBP6247752.1 helix-turn-helix transcriptional regulator [Trichococcus sp.]MBP7129399.1 helix-turn-helix transcriptional regulator [Trichococcus sp.]MBP9595037.1 helix-turn-helix transcriptional regulator [Trichococcus sp.]HQZ20622.1 helix-turn-helix domain-containing protein [Trichococcus flocculiformis]HRF52702.1 helix-turn-helix domain-containing protein [Trichococcus flocculiformis]
MEVKKCICPKFEKTFSILGKKWTGLIIEVLMDGDKRFKELAAQIPNVSDRVLVERLKELEDEKIVVRTENPAAAIKVMYGLSEKGKALNSVMQEIQTWSDAWV